MSDQLSGKLILVTGAGDGIGKAAAQAYAQQGATVILLGRTQAKLESVYDTIVEQGLPEPVIHPLDLASATVDDYNLLGKSILEQFPALDGLLHNASVLGALGPIEHYPAEQWTKIMQINVNAMFMLTKALLPALAKSDDGRILMTSSSVGRKGRAYWGAYAVSKFATEGLMQVLAEELRNTSSIRVNSINPGATRTEMRRAAYPAEDPATLPTAESLMPAYVYLMSAQSRAIHGEALDIRELLARVQNDHASAN
ncbi:MAG TPA: YciK family oxidoreductase [Pseudohongiella sp.]|nr:YciK family oxidoreductase [Gammaproteobacteria bacterium]HBN13584.1 YciK family oxidoreductase [Pseudohongiella sp.]|tara:strand:+ start:1169 stop:1933 length:765 start_codon:yes stop_codon:yes gene_type:complete